MGVAMSALKSSRTDLIEALYRRELARTFDFGWRSYRRGLHRNPYSFDDHYELAQQWHFGWKAAALADRLVTEAGL